MPQAVGDATSVPRARLGCGWLCSMQCTHRPPGWPCRHPGCTYTLLWPGQGSWGHLLLLQGTGCARGGVLQWALDLSGTLGSLSRCAGGSSTSCSTMVTLPCSCWSKDTGGAGLEWTKGSAGVPHHATPSQPSLSTEAAERGLVSCAACLIPQEPCRTVACSEPDVSAGLQTTQVTDYCLTTRLLCLPPALSDISVVTVESSSCHHLSPSVTHTTPRLGH